MAELDLEIARLAAENKRLKAENDRLWQAVTKAAEWFAKPMGAQNLNEGFAALNRVLPKEQRIMEVAWGVSSLADIRQTVKELCGHIGLPEYIGFLDRMATRPDDGLKRQPLGGIRYG